MNNVIEETNWIPFLKRYSSQNEDRPTRLGVFETHDGNTEDLWIEDGLPLVAIDGYPDKEGVSVDVIFESYTHPVGNVIRVIEHSGDEDNGLDLIDTAGRMTVLRFEASN